MQIKIGAIKYKIKYVDPSAFDEDVKCGMLNREDDTIYIDNKLSDENKALAMWHEIIHAINGELSETTVDFLASAIYQILKENKL